MFDIQLSFVFRGFQAFVSWGFPGNMMDVISGSAPDIIVNPAQVFPDQSQGHKLCPHENKENGKQGKNPIGRPYCPKGHPHDKQEESKSDAEKCQDSADNTQQSQGKGGHAGEQIKLKGDQFQKAVL